MPDGWAKYTNRLFLESSPYLLQHAHNPVNWFPWGEEAFETARRLNRPVLLSVGYSTCHWCHVMEEESFEDDTIAKFLNEHYIAIKVDREERPDVDAIYMSAVQLMTGRGGWPMTVWLKPDRKPYYGATYLPPRDGERGVPIGFLTHLRQLKEVYDTMPDRVSAHSEKLTAAIQQMLNPKVGKDLPTAKSLHAAVNLCKQNFDPAFGGLKGAPKFPSTLPVRLLLNYYRRTGDRESLNIAITTLNQMAAGGIHDHVGGGFHRYSTDEEWLVPHFEKMLYDNALLTLAYLDAYQVTGESHFADVVVDILRYIGRDMTSPAGAFYSATDADSQTPGGHQEEGYYYTWTSSELEEILGNERADIISKYFAVSPRGNFEGRSILHTPLRSTEVAQQLELTEEYVRAAIADSKANLYRARSRRPPPFRDEKILTAWNALMISAYARASFVLSNQEYLDRAVRAANFLLTHLFVDDNLFRAHKEGKPEHDAYLDDYAFLTAALIDLYEVTHDTSWLNRAIKVDSILERRYEDKTGGGYYMTGHDHPPLIAREKPSHDGALPSGNSIAIL
ncbi:MAG: thioredoxin domain-containing protein, partial [Gammaproteobacteria bacterium]